MSAEKNHTSRTTVRQKPKDERHIIAFLFFICLLLTGFLGSMLFALKSLDLPDLRSVGHYQPKQASLIVDRYGQVVERVFIENRTVVSLAEMNPLLPKAFVAAEDGRFYEHPGLDFFSVLRAAINNARQGRRGQGGSTITQQVARSLLLSPEKTYLRKFREAILAWRIDMLLDKEDILYVYLNQIYLGEGAYGVEAASQVYFGKHASELTLGEVAILAGLPQAPSRYSPRKHLDRAVVRQRYVLNRMVDDGYITPEEARVAYARKVKVSPEQALHDPRLGYYLDVVKRRAATLIDKPLDEAGATIYTFLDKNMQQEAQAAVSRGSNAVAARNLTKGKRPQAALVCMEGATGKVRALVGGNDFIASPFNRATQAKRPAGSVFKPLLYSAALLAGWQPGSAISDAALAVPGGSKGTWRPKNYSGIYHGETTLVTALAKSYNAAAVRLMQKIGVKRVHRVAKAAGINAALPPDLSLALGAVDVSLLEMTAAYSPFVNQGWYRAPRFIERVLYHGQVLGAESPESRRVLSAGVARNMHQMLEQVVQRGTGHRAGTLPGRIGGKTGTSDKNRDAWFIGFRGKYITGVWVGHDRNESLGKKENGGRTATPIWVDFMKKAAVK